MLIVKSALPKKCLNKHKIRALINNFTAQLSHFVLILLYKYISQCITFMFNPVHIYANSHIQFAPNHLRKIHVCDARKFGMILEESKASKLLYDNNAETVEKN